MRYGRMWLVRGVEGSGFAVLPLAARSLARLAQVAREEAMWEGAQEISLPAGFANGVLELARRVIRAPRLLPLSLYALDGRALDVAVIDRAPHSPVEVAERILSRCTLEVHQVGDDLFVPGGSDPYLACPSGCTAPVATGSAPLRRVETPGVRSVEAVAASLGVPTSKVIKTLVFLADGAPLVVLLRGDRAVNEDKLGQLVDVNPRKLRLAGEDVVAAVTGAPVGFAGPVTLRPWRGVRVMGDREVRNMTGAVTGANEADAHFADVDVRRDVELSVEWADLRVFTPRETCPTCAAPMEVRTGNRVAWLDERTVDDERRAAFLHVDLVAVLREVELRLMDPAVWPAALAPFQVHIVALPGGEELAGRLHDTLDAAGIDVLLDDRDERAGTKFKDADLLGARLRLVVGKRALTEGGAELQRPNIPPEVIPVDDVLARVRKELAA
jgi:prolyl-tRNA synthetase